MSRQEAQTTAQGYNRQAIRTRPVFLRNQNTYFKPELQTDIDVRLGFAMNGKIRLLVMCEKRESEAKAGLKTNV
jgi:hypothetical protein